MTLLDYLKSNWEGVPIYFNTVKFDDYFINIVPFMLGNKVVKYDEDKNYNNGGDLFITDNNLLIEKAKRENFSIIILGDYPEGVEVSKNIRLISAFNKPSNQVEEVLDLFEPYKLFLKMAGFENAILFNFNEPIQGGFIPTTAPPPPPPLRKTEPPLAPSSGQEKKFIPTTAPPPPPPLRKSEPPSSSGQEKKFIPTTAPPPPPPLRKVEVEQKNDIINPPIVPEELDVDGKKLKLLNDKLFGGTKTRVLQKVIRDLPYEEIVYAGPDTGMAQIAIGAVAKKYGKKATIFVNTPSKVRILPELVNFGQSNLGIKYDFSKGEKGRTLYDTNEDAKKYVEENPQKRILLPFGLKDEKTVSEFASILKEAIKSIPQPKRMWIVAGSGMLLEVFHRIWPKTQYMVVQVGKKVDPSSLNHNGVQDKLFIAPEKFQFNAQFQPPYDTIEWYDAKLWRFVLQEAEEGDYIWNVATRPSLQELNRFLLGSYGGYYSSMFESDKLPASPTLTFDFLTDINKDLEDFSLDKPKFIPTQPPPPPPPLRNVKAPSSPQYVPTSPPQSPRKIEINKQFEPKLWKMPSDEEKKQMNEDLRLFLEYNKSKRLQGTVSQDLIKPKSKFPFVPFVKGEMLEDTKDEFKQPKFIPTTAPPPPPPLRNIKTPPSPQYAPTSPPQPLKKEQPPSTLFSFIKQKNVEKPKSRFPFVPFVKGGMLEDTKDEFKYANIIKMKNNEYDYFPKRNKEYMYTDVSLYSSADVSHSLKTAELISKYYDISNKTLTEASACIGGNSWSFADKVKNINLVEIDSNNFKALKHNMSVVFNKDPGSLNKDVINNTLEYKAGKTMNFFNDNYIKIRDKLGGDIIFYDPPWGGVDYKNEPQVGYSYNGKFYNLEDMSKKSFYKVAPELIVFRIPISSNILDSDYKYQTTVIFNDLYGKPIYKLVFLSDIKGNDLPTDIKVKRINYKKIEYELV